MNTFLLIFNIALSIVGLIGAFYFYDDLIKEYLRTKWKPFRLVTAIRFLFIGAFLSLFWETLDRIINPICDAPVNLIIRIVLCILLAGIGVVLYNNRRKLHR